MAEPRDLSDEELAAVLRDVLERTEPVPDDLVAAARGALTWRTVDAELAELLHDSARDEEVLVRAAPGATSRLLTFAAGELGIDLEADAGGELIGVVSPPGRYDVELQAADGPTAAPLVTDTDDNGLFRFACRAGARVRVLVRSGQADADGHRRRIVTPWTTL